MATKYISTGPGFLGLLTLVFVIAKLWDKVDWSWWIVFAPIWVPVLLSIVATLIIILLLLLGYFIWLGATLINKLFGWN